MSAPRIRSDRPAEIGVRHADVRTALDPLNERSHEPRHPDNGLHHNKIDDAMIRDMLPTVAAT